MKLNIIKTLIPLLALSVFSSSCGNNELPDKDFDGLANAVDKAPEDNNYTGVLSYDNSGLPNGIDVSFKMDYRDFVENKETEFNNNFARLGAIIPGLHWDSSKISLINSISEHTYGDLEFIFKQFGCQDYSYVDMSLQKFDEDEADFTKFTMAHHPFEYKGNSYDVMFLTFKPTEALAEWASNIDFGADSDEYYSKTGQHKLWTDKENHKGLDVSCSRVMPIVNDYLTSKVKVEKPIIFVSGYSRGAGVANMFAAKLTDLNKYKVFCYSFGTMRTNVKSDASKYNNIFSLINDDDIVTQLPFDTLGYKHYGRTFNLSIKNNYLNEYLERTKLDEYLCLDPKWKNHISLLGNTREDIYKISDKNVGYSEYYYTEEDASSDLTYYQNLVKKYKIEQYFEFSEVTYVDGYYYFEIYNCGAAIIGIASNILLLKIGASDLSGFTELLALFDNFSPIITDILEAASNDLSKIYYYVERPHIPMSYYFIAEKSLIK